MKAVFAAIAILAALVLSAAAADSDGISVRQDMSDDDFIITGDRYTGTIITYKSPVVPVKPGDPDFEWKTVTIPSGDDFTATRFSEVGDVLNVRVDGGILGRLSLMEVDDLTLTEKYVTINLKVLKGTIRELRPVTVDESLVPFLDTSYANTFTPVESLRIDIIGGDVTEISPTSDMIGVDSMDVSIGAGAKVDRLLTSGINGRYGGISFSLKGGEIGYMSNIKSRIGYIDYVFENGSVNYFCIGADTEYSENSVLTEMSTSYIAGDVRLYVDDTVALGKTILGAGVVDVPNILWNGERVKPSTVKNFVLDAEAAEILMDTCFLNERRNQAYSLAEYRIGYNPSLSWISSNYDDHGRSMPVYGEKGVWSGISSIDIAMGTSVFCNSNIRIMEDGVLNIGMGGRFVTSNLLRLHGAINNDGMLENSSVIQKVDSGDISGKVTGDGFVASTIRYASSDRSISVISSDDTVIISRSSSGEFTSISASLLDGDRTVSLQLPEGVSCSGSSFLVSFRDRDTISGFDEAFEIAIEGIDDSILALCTTNATFKTTAPYDYDAEIYMYDEATNSYAESERVEPTFGAIAFKAPNNTLYQVKYVDESADSNGKETLILALVVAIIAVAALTIYVGIRKVRSSRQFAYHAVCIANAAVMAVERLGDLEPVGAVELYRFCVCRTDLELYRRTALHEAYPLQRIYQGPSDPSPPVGGIHRKERYRHPSLVEDGPAEDTVGGAEDVDRDELAGRPLGQEEGDHILVEVIVQVPVHNGMDGRCIRRHGRPYHLPRLATAATAAMIATMGARYIHCPLGNGSSSFPSDEMTYWLDTVLVRLVVLSVTVTVSV